MGKVNIVEFGLHKMSDDYKRNFFYQLDSQLKAIHQNGGIVRNFSPQDIFVDEETRTPSFMAVYPSLKYYFDEEDKKQAQIENVSSLSTLAFCVYLSKEEEEYNLNNGLLQFDILKNNLAFTLGYFPEEDREYYLEVFGSDLERPLYYSDYIDKKMASSNSKGESLSLSKSTPVGRAMSQRNGEAAYVSYILMFSVVGVITMLSIFVIFLFI